MLPFVLHRHSAWILATASILALEKPGFAQPPPSAAAPPPTPTNTEPLPAPGGTGSVMQLPPQAPPPEGPAPAPTDNEKHAEPFAFGDFTWLNGSNRQHKALLDTPMFTGSFLLDVNYTASAHNPIDNTVSARRPSRATTSSRSRSWASVATSTTSTRAGACMTQYGMRCTLVPRNDFSSFHGQFDLQTALRYISEAYGGYHWDALHGINLDMGIFMSYVGLFSYDNFENWMYLPSFTSDNTPWFFNGMRLQIFTSDKLKIEPWLINGWQTYGKFNEMPGFGFQILWRPIEYFSVSGQRLRRLGHAGQPGTLSLSQRQQRGGQVFRPAAVFLPRQGRLLRHVRPRRRTGRRRDALRGQRYRKIQCPGAECRVYHRSAMHPAILERHGL